MDLNQNDWSCLLEDALWAYRIAYQTSDRASSLLGNQEELEELCFKAYENFHDIRILRKELTIGQKVLLFRSRLRLIADKLCSRDEANNSTFKVHGHQLKPYHEGLNLSSNQGEVEIITLIEPIILEEPQFCNRSMAILLEKYGVEHRVATGYHPQTNDQAEKMANLRRNDWSCLLEDALWAHQTTYRTLLGMSPYQIVFGKAFHLSVEIEHQVYWAIKKCNMAYDLAKLRLEAYENSRIYKEKVKHFHDSRILRKDFTIDQKVLLFHSRFKLIAGKETLCILRKGRDTEGTWKKKV
ncbi:hypothetical protein CR513_03151, partial [Mucuna pruriens]